MSASRPVRADRRRNYERLVTAAVEVFTESGPHAPLDDIAKRAGVGNATLYRHFPHRLALLEAAYRDQVEALCARADELARSHSPAEAFDTWLGEYTADLARRHGLAEVLKTALGGDTEPMTTYRDALRDAAGTLLTGAKRAGTVRADADLLVVLKLAHGIAMAAQIGPDGSNDAGRMLAIALAGLRAP